MVSKPREWHHTTDNAVIHLLRAMQHIEDLDNMQDLSTVLFLFGCAYELFHASDLFFSSSTVHMF